MLSVELCLLFLQARQMVDGLNYGGADAQTDFATIVYQLRQVCISWLP